MEGLLSTNHQIKQRLSPQKSAGTASHFSNKQNQVGTVMLYGIPIVSLVIESQERLCLAQISNTLLKQYSYNEIHNRRVALGITCVQCTPVQLEILRRAGAMPVSSRRCGMITRREAERLCKSFLGDNAPPRLPDDFAFSVHHECAWGCRGAFLPSRYNSSRAKCIKCSFCGLFFSPNKFIFHSHRTSPNATYIQPDAANFNSWRRHMKLSGTPPDDVVHAWEDVKAMFNGGTRKRLLAGSSGVGTVSPATRPALRVDNSSSLLQSGSLPSRSSIATAAPISSSPAKQIKLDTATATNSPYPTPTNTPIPVPTPPRVPPFPDLALPISMMDYVWQNGVNAEGVKHQFPFPPYAVPWFGNAKRSVLGLSSLSSVSTQQETLLQQLCPPNSEKLYHHSAFRPVFPAFGRPDILVSPGIQNNITKRHSEELLLPKRRYSREPPEKAENSPSSNECNDSEGNSCRSVADSVDKENELRKNPGNGEEPEVLRCDSPQNLGLKMTFKKESVSETSDDSEEPHKGFPPKSHPEGKDLFDVTKLLAMKPGLLDETVFKFREFSPNILDAISSLKAEERGVYSGLPARMYPEYVLERRGEDGCRRRGASAAGKGEREGDTRSEEDADDDEETVDVETTDDVPAGGSSFAEPQENPGKKPGAKAERWQEAGEDGRRSRGSPEPERPGKIWTIARFSLEETGFETPQVSVLDLRSAPPPSAPGFLATGDQGPAHKVEKEAAQGKRNAGEPRESPAAECLGCCRVAFGNG